MAIVSMPNSKTTFFIISKSTVAYLGLYFCSAPYISWTKLVLLWRLTKPSVYPLDSVLITHCHYSVYESDLIDIDLNHQLALISESGLVFAGSI